MFPPAPHRQLAVVSGVSVLILALLDQPNAGPNSMTLIGLAVLPAALVGER